MTRLFLRFYVAVLLILFASWIVQGFVFRMRANEQNARVIERAMAGGVRSARNRILKSTESTYDATLSEIRSDFEYPLEVYELDSGPFSETERDRLRKNNEVVLFTHNGAFVGTRLDTSRAIAMGPLPSFVGPSQWELLAGLGAILSIAAGAIALVLRPVVKQLREVERTATAIADGDLSARIDSKAIPKAQPIAKAFNTMAGRTEDLLRTQRELLQAVSHDLRTPLARMRFAIDLVGLAETDEEREPRLASLDAATEELSDLVGELLNYVRIETADAETRIKDVAVLELLQRLVVKRSAMYPDLQIDTDCPVDATIRADEGGFHRAVGNLLANACRFAKQHVRISVRETDNGVSVSIEDDGEGIPESDRERVLNPFVRLTAGGENGKGIGLGLTLVNRIVKSHDGEIQINDSSALGGCHIRTVWKNSRDSNNGET